MESVASCVEEAPGIARCSRCTLPVEPAIVHGHLGADEQGVCDFCRTWDARWADKSSAEEARAQLDGHLAWAASRGGDYDALVPISGGKDSLSVLDILRSEYPHLRLLAATLDNGFLADHALAACRTVCKALDVEHVLWSPPQMRALARLFLSKTGHFCGPCQVAMMNMYHVLSRRHRIPLIVLGTSRRFDGAHPEAANPWTPPFFEAVLRGEPEAEALRADVCGRGLLVRFGLATLTGRVRTVLLPDHVAWSVPENQARVEARYQITLRSEHADCLGAPVADWLYKRRCGFGQKAAGLAAAVRNGQLPRDDALAELSRIDEFGDRFPETEAAGFLERTGLTPGEVAACAPLRPQPYFDVTFRAVGVARDLLGFSVA
jgi:hypothetical protein